MKASFFMIRLPMAIMCVLLLVSHHIAAASGSEDTANLWSDLVRQYNNPQEKVFEEWNVVTGVTLVKTATGIPSGHAALAGVLTHLEKSNSLDLSRFSRGDSKVLLKIFDHFPEFIANEDFAARLQKLYETYIRKVDNTPAALKDISKGQSLAESLVKLSGNTEKAARDYLTERLYSPVITSEMSADNAKSFIDCGAPFVLTQKGKSLLCLGYLERRGKIIFIVADSETVKQGEMSEADLIVGTGEWAERRRKRARERDVQFGLLKTDAEFVVSNSRAEGISFTTIMPGDAAVMICSLPPGDAEIREFIRKNQRSIDDIIKFIMENHNEEE